MIRKRPLMSPAAACLLATPLLLFGVCEHALAAPHVSRIADADAKLVSTSESAEPGVQSPKPPAASAPATAPPAEAGMKPAGPADGDGTSAGAPRFRSMQVPPAVRAEQQRRKQHEEEIERARVDLAKETANPKALTRLVDLLLLEHRGAEALEAAKVFAAANETNALGYVALGRTLFWEGDYEGSLLQFQRASMLDLKLPSAFYWLARARIALGDRSGALEAANKLLELTPDDVAAIATVARVMEEARRYDEAGKLWDRVLARRSADGKEDVTTAARALMCKDLAREKPPSFELPPSGQTVQLFSFNKIPAVKVRINSKIERYMILDLSAQDTVILPKTSQDSLAREFGLGDAPSTSGGEATGAPANAVLDAIQIGGLIVKRVPATVNPFLKYPSDEIGGLLGRSFLSQFLLTIDYVNRTVTFAPPAARAIDGARLYANSAILIDAASRGQQAGKFLVDTSTYTPGPVSILWAQDHLDLNAMSQGVTPVLTGNYSYMFTMPHIEIGGVVWKMYRATGIDLRSLSERVGTELNGILANSLLNDTRITLDLAHLRMRIERLREQTYRSPGKIKGTPSVPGATGTSTPADNPAKDGKGTVDPAPAGPSPAPPRPPSADRSESR